MHLYGLKFRWLRASPKCRLRASPKCWLRASPKCEAMNQYDGSMSMCNAKEERLKFSARQNIKPPRVDSRDACGIPDRTPLTPTSPHNLDRLQFENMLLPRRLAGQQ